MSLRLLVCVVAAWASSAAATSAATSATCPTGCQCKWKGGKESVTCHQAGLSDIPDALDVTVQVLDLSGNALLRLSDQVRFPSRPLHQGYFDSSEKIIRAIVLT